MNGADARGEPRFGADGDGGRGGCDTSAEGAPAPECGVEPAGNAGMSCVRSWRFGAGEPEGAPAGALADGAARWPMLGIISVPATPLRFVPLDAASAALAADGVPP